MAHAHPDRVYMPGSKTHPPHLRILRQPEVESVGRALDYLLRSWPKMKVAPIGRNTLISLTLLTAAPLLLVATLVTPVDALLKMVIKLLA